jgi:hypothetical protein
VHNILGTRLGRLPFSCLPGSGISGFYPGGEPEGSARQLPSWIAIDTLHNGVGSVRAESRLRYKFLSFCSRASARIKVLLNKSSSCKLFGSGSLSGRSVVFPTQRRSLLTSAMTTMPTVAAAWM